MEFIQSGRHLAKSIYGIIVTATLLVILEDFEDNAWRVALIIVFSISAVILAEYYSTLFGKQLDKHARLSGPEKSEVFKNCLCMFLGTVTPTLLFVLAGFGVIELSLAFDLAEILVAALLFVYGYFYGQVSGHSTVKSLAYGAVNVCIAIVIVFIKSIVHGFLG